MGLYVILPFLSYWVQFCGLWVASIQTHYEIFPFTATAACRRRKGKSGGGQGLAADGVAARATAEGGGAPARVIRRGMKWVERGGRRCGGGHGGGWRSLEVVGEVLGLAWCLGLRAAATTAGDGRPAIGVAV